MVRLVTDGATDGRVQYWVYVVMGKLGGGGFIKNQYSLKVTLLDGSNPILTGLRPPLGGVVSTEDEAKAECEADVVRRGSWKIPGGDWKEVSGTSAKELFEGVFPDPAKKPGPPK